MRTHQIHGAVAAASLALAACGSGTHDTPGPPTWRATVTLDPARVALHGTLAEGMCSAGALANLDRPDLPVVGFPCGASQTRLRPDGQVLYLIWSGGAPADPMRKGIFRMAPDVATLLTTYSLPELWEYPPDPAANDARLATACDGSADNEVHAYVLQQGTGEVAYRCLIDPELAWRDARGAVIARDLLDVYAWNENGLLLGRDRLERVVVVAPGGSSTEVWTLPDAVHVARAYGDGFRVVTVDPAAPLTGMARFTVSPSGETALEGAYAPAPDGFDCGRVPLGLFDAPEALSADGDLYELGFGPAVQTLREVVCRKPLAPGTAEIVYDELHDPTRSPGATPPTGRPSWWVKIHMGDMLVTGP